MHRLSLYEDCIKLNIPCDNHLIDLSKLNWVQYNPRKNNARYGCSITSLDGVDSGIPDLDSIIEYNMLYGTKYTEKDFCTLTEHSTPFKYFLNNFEVGRSHYLHLAPGGHFPWHRDNDPITVRIVYTIQNCTSDNLVWLEDDKPLHLEDNNWYYINTRKRHSVFSFSDCYFAVFNMIFHTKNFNNLQMHFSLK